MFENLGNYRRRRKFPIHPHYYMATTTKRDLILSISEQSNLTQSEVSEVVQSFIEEITGELANGNEVVLRNFGTFRVVQRAAKVGRNPLKPEVDVVIPEKNIAQFKVGKGLKERVMKLPVT